MKLVLLLHMKSLLDSVKGIFSASAPSNTPNLATALINYHCDVQPKRETSGLDEFFYEPYPDTIPKDTTLNGSFF